MAFHKPSLSTEVVSHQGYEAVGWVKMEGQSCERSCRGQKSCLDPKSWVRSKPPFEKICHKAAGNHTHTAPGDWAGEQPVADVVVVVELVEEVHVVVRPAQAGHVPEDGGAEEQQHLWLGEGLHQRLEVTHPRFLLLLHLFASLTSSLSTERTPRISDEDGDEDRDQDAKSPWQDIGGSPAVVEQVRLGHLEAEEES